MKTIVLILAAISVICGCIVLIIILKEYYLELKIKQKDIEIKLLKNQIELDRIEYDKKYGKWASISNLLNDKHTANK